MKLEYFSVDCGGKRDIYLKHCQWGPNQRIKACLWYCLSVVREAMIIRFGRLGKLQTEMHKVLGYAGHVFYLIA